MRQEGLYSDGMETYDTPPSIEPWHIDPRNPNAVRPKSSKSIPSKCQ